MTRSAQFAVASAADRRREKSLGKSVPPAMKWKSYSRETHPSTCLCSPYDSRLYLDVASRSQLDATTLQIIQLHRIIALNSIEF